MAVVNAATVVSRLAQKAGLQCRLLPQQRRGQSWSEALKICSIASGLLDPDRLLDRQQEAVIFVAQVQAADVQRVLARNQSYCGLNSIGRTLEPIDHPLQH